MSQLINGKYELIQRIGQGSFGSIYKARNIRTNEIVAIKVEVKINNLSLLLNETRMYKYLNGEKGIPTIKWFGSNNKYYFMVINYLGISLEELVQKHKKLPLKTTLQLGVKILDLLKRIHSKGLVHRDIKPDNILFGPDGFKELFLIDFGFCKSYSREIKKTSGLIGSSTFASINSHKLLDLSRRDDILSLSYLLVYLYLGNLPWKNIPANNDDVILQLKEQFSVNCCGVEVSPILKELIEYATNMKFDETPKYEYFRSMFEREIAIKRI